MTTDEIIHDILVYFMPTIVLIVVYVIANAFWLQDKLKKTGWTKEDDPPWDDDLE